MSGYYPQGRLAAAVPAGPSLTTVRNAGLPAIGARRAAPGLL